MTTGEGGGWGQTGFTDGVLYRVTPSDAGSPVFAPAFREVSAGQSAVDFAADGPPPQTYAVSGTVKKRAKVFANVEIRFAAVSGPGSSPPPVFTGADGRWSQTGLAAGTTYRVTPVLKGYRFKPASRDVDAEATGVNFKPKRL